MLSSPPSVGTLVLNADGSFTYTPPTTPPTTDVTFAYQPEDAATSALGLVTFVTLEAAPTVAVTSVTFANAQPILNDLTSVAFPKGWSSANPNDSNPVAVVAGQQVKVTAVFTITAGTVPQFFPIIVTAKTQALLGGLGPCLVTIEGTAVAAGNQLMFSGIATSVFFSLQLFR